MHFNCKRYFSFACPEKFEKVSLGWFCFKYSTCRLWTCTHTHTITCTHTPSYLHTPYTHKITQSPSHMHCRMHKLHHMHTHTITSTHTIHIQSHNHHHIHTVTCHHMHTITHSPDNSARHGDKSKIVISHEQVPLTIFHPDAPKVEAIIRNAWGDAQLVSNWTAWVWLLKLNAWVWLLKLVLRKYHVLQFCAMSWQ